MEIRNRKALVFGGTSGIGLAAARQLAAGGARVVAISRNPDRAGGAGENISLAACDVRDGKALQALFEAEAPFDILVSAATGGERAFGSFLDMEMEGFKASFDKLWGYANVVRYGAPHLPPEGTIVLVSGSPARRGRTGQIALAAVGGAVEAFAREAAKEIAPRRINIVSPGVIDTPLVPGDGEERRKALERMIAGNLIARPGTADEAAKAVLFLVENDYVTGTTVDVDGGWLIA